VCAGAGGPRAGKRFGSSPNGHAAAGNDHAAAGNDHTAAGNDHVAAN
jgi:hypothetical protein